MWFDCGCSSYRNAHGIGGWIGWGKWIGLQDPIVFSKDQSGEYHVLYILMRDISNTAESARVCRIRMHVVDYSFSRFALLVDDAVLVGQTPDRVHDDYIKSVVLNRLYSYGQVDSFNVYGVNDAGSYNPLQVPDVDLVQYQHIIWNLNLFRSNIPNSPGGGLRKLEVDGNRGVSNYLFAGGRLFICGAPVMGALEGRVNIYRRLPPSDTDTVERERLYYNLLYMRNTIFSYQDNQGGICAKETGGMYRAISFNPNYPDLFLDTKKWDPFQWDPFQPDKYKGGLELWEGLKVNQTGDSPIHLEGLDTLYVAETWNRSTSVQCRNATGPGNDSVCAWRYHSTHADTLAQRQHGRVIVFDFQPFYFQRDRMTDAGTSAVNWLVTGRDR